MSKKTAYFFILSVLITIPVCADQNSDSNKNVAYEQARVDYRAYLDQLKSLNQQYKEVTGELKNIIQEEGLPVWDEKTGGINLLKGSDVLGSGNANIKETDSEMTVILELPGLKKESIHITIQESKILKVTAQKKLPTEPVELLIQLPAMALDRGQQASYEDGILTIHIPKLPQSKTEVPVPIQ